MIGKANKEDLAENIIEVPGKGWIVTVPYTNDRFLSKEFYTGLEAQAMEMAGVSSPAPGEPQKAGGLPIIYVGHAAIKDTDYSGHQKQNDRFIGGIECTGIDEIGSLYDYIALGHIHKAQTFNGGRARYCGTPLPVSFDEVREGYEHGFDVVEIDAHGAAPKIRTVPVKLSRELLNIPAEGHAEWDDVMKELKALPDDLEALIRLNVLLKSNDLLPFNKDTQIQTAVATKKAAVAVINPKREAVKSDQEDEALGTLTLQELQEIDHKTILKEYAKKKEFEFTKEFEEMFDFVYKIVTDPDYEDQ
jgi:exonuclease SbcD